MKKILPLLFFCFLSVTGYSQYANNWISYGQKYHKVKVWQEGIHRISVNNLLSAGVEVYTCKHQQIQMWHNGVEIPIFIADINGNDSLYDQGEYLEFYGERNDGSFDKQLYADSNWIPNTNYSLFTDTAAYFITISQTNFNNKRYNTIRNFNFSSYAPSDYFLHDARAEFNGTYVAGLGVYDIDFANGEGWMSQVYGNKEGNPELNVTLSTQNAVVTGPDAQIEFSLGGANNNPHNLQVNGPGVAYADIFNGLQTVRQTFTTPTSTLGSASLYNFKSVVPNTGYTDKFCVAYINVRYPHSFNLEGKATFRMLLPDASAQTKSRLDVSNVNITGTDSIFVWDVYNNKRYAGAQSGSTYQVLVDNDNSGSNKKLFAAGQSTVTNVSYLQIVPVNPQGTNSGYFTNYNSVAKDSAFVIISNRAIWSAAQAYNTYRDSTTNGKSMLLDIDELYDQFAYGIQKHPSAIINFSKFALANWNTGALHPPQHIFILGKGIKVNEMRYSTTNFANCLIPTFGWPGSDLKLTSGFNGSLYEPVIPIGRITSESNAEAVIYLNKVKQYESYFNSDPEPWMKEVLHFSGGENQQEASVIAGYMDGYKSIIEDTLIGAHVTTYYKNSSAPIVINQSDSLQQRIDDGVQLMTFFGHASGSSFDQSTDDISEYQNYGKYPMIIANSCNAGDMHSPYRVIAENFTTVHADKGAIGFIASVSLGDAYNLSVYSNNFYKNVSYKNYGQSIGKILKQTIFDTEYDPIFNDPTLAKTSCLEMQLCGDPAITFYNWQKPEYELLSQQVTFNPANISTDMDTFSINVVTRNLARAIPDSFDVKIKRTFPDGTDSVYVLRRGNCFYDDSLSLVMHNYGFNSAGINTFEVSADYDLNEVSEEVNDYTNNIISSVVYVTSSDIIPVYPYKYAIYPYNTVTLKASTANPFAGLRDYKFEIDTVDLSIDAPSPMYRFGTVTSAGGVIQFTPSAFSLTDSAVYYWRVADDSIQYDPVKFRWNESSFQYIPQRTGYAQADLWQFKNDNLENVLIDSTNREFDFIQNNKALLVQTFGDPITSASQLNSTGIFFNNQPTEYNGCPNTNVQVSVLDSVSLEAWLTCGNNFGQNNTFTPTQMGAICDLNTPGAVGCGGPGSAQRVQRSFQFKVSDTSSMQGMQNLLNQVPVGNYIIVYSFLKEATSLYPDFYSAMQSVGFNNVNLVGDYVPYIFFMKKGDASSVTSLIGTSLSDTLRLQMLLSSVWNRGTITTENIGPSGNWQSLHWYQTPKESSALKDTVALNILGLNSTSNVWDTLYNGLQISTYDTSLSWINAQQYPYLKLQSYLRDDSLLTPPQMNRWQIYYDEVPECALNQNRDFSFYNNPLFEGDTMRVRIAIDNLTDIPMDSLRVKFYLFDGQNLRHDFKNAKVDSLRPNQYLIASALWDSTWGTAGVNNLWIEANPYTADHQLEKYHFNNLAQIKFDVTKDNVNPILDVTFDGVHILDGDIVSGRPVINIQLHDENKFLALNDTSNFRVYLKSPSQNTLEKISFNQIAYNSSLLFTPAVLPKNSCKISFDPTFIEDGIYTLSVEAQDRSGNESGKYNYSISFEVINKSTITEILNYPNPFSTSTRFVFTLTGNEIPTNMQIQIMTVSGKVVREITQQELGNIHIGRNITDFAWDGKDQFGDQLANGLYLYKVTSRLHGAAIEKRETDADKFFKKGWGKMYLMR